MPTKPIPAGTVNTTINVPLHWRLRVGKFADSRGMSLGEAVKQAVERIIEQDECERTAEQLRWMRAQVSTSAKVTLAIFLLILCAIRSGMINTSGPDLSHGNSIAIEFDAIMANRVGGSR